MKQLSGLDASFLYLETPEMPMHVGSLNIYELPASHRGNWLAALRRHVAARLPLMPVLRRKLAWMPLNLAAPAWVDAEPDLDEHIVGVTLPAGSGLAELEMQVGLLHAQLLDRSRPLWKFFVFEGLAPGDAGQRRCAGSDDDAGGRQQRALLPTAGRGDGQNDGDGQCDGRPGAPAPGSGTGSR